MNLELRGFDPGRTPFSYGPICCFRETIKDVSSWSEAVEFAGMYIARNGLTRDNWSSTMSGIVRDDEGKDIATIGYSGVVWTTPNATTGRIIMLYNPHTKCTHNGGDVGDTSCEQSTNIIGIVHDAAFSLTFSVKTSSGMFTIKPHLTGDGRLEIAYLGQVWMFDSRQNRFIWHDKSACLNQLRVAIAAALETMEKNRVYPTMYLLLHGLLAILD